MSEELDKSFTEVVSSIHAAWPQAYQSVHIALVDLYWQVGKYVSSRIDAGTLGEGTVNQLAGYVAERHPELKRGFTRRNLYRMRRFYESYRNDGKLSSLVRQLPWTHNIIVLSKCARPKEREFYVRLVQRKGWNKHRLEKEIDGALFERMVLSPPIMSPAVAQLHPSAHEVFMDTYVLEFLTLPEPHTESKLQRVLVGDIRTFLEVLGLDLFFIGEEYRIQVGGKDFSSIGSSSIVEWNVWSHSN